MPRRVHAAPAADDLPETLQFMRLLWEVVHSLETGSKRMRRTIGLTGPQRLVLRIVGLRPGVSAGELATVLHVHPSTLTGVLSRLATQRLVQRRAAADDRRRAVLALTARGAQLNARTTGTVEARVSRLLGGMTPRQRRAARSSLTALAAALSR